MGLEIERKYLVTSDGYRQVAPQELKQGYLNRDKQRNVRVRIDGELAFLTIKGLQKGLTRAEYEYPIPIDDARQILNDICEPPIIEKRRYLVPYAGYTWEVDEFAGENQGLVVAEIELSREDEQVELPPWVGEEVTHDTRYLNANLVTKPYSTWGRD